MCPIPIRPDERKKKEATPLGPPKSSPEAEPPQNSIGLGGAGVKRRCRSGRRIGGANVR